MQQRIAFVHPDLGLGGAEKLVVDAAVESVIHGNYVHVYTAYYDVSRCFEETKTGGFPVTVAGGWFPRTVGGRLIALCAYIRCLLVALHVVWTSWLNGKQYDVIVVDQVSAVIPVLKAFTTAKVVFYCHFPDLLLAKRPSAVHKLYRMPIDWLEQTTTGQADCILVNSGFTRQVFAETFGRLHRRGILPEVLYPAVSVPSDASLEEAWDSWATALDPRLVDFIGQGPTFLSINRFERKKGIGLALEALRELMERCPEHRGGLVVAGGYDKRLAENVEHLEELRALAKELHLGPDRVWFLPSFTDQQRQLLLAAAVAVVYTPQHEHFGIVPLEAMAAGRPVIAVNSGGPTESVLDATTGFLCEPTPAAFASAMQRLTNPAEAGHMGAAARKHVQERFSRSAFGDRLQAYYDKLSSGNGSSSPHNSSKPAD